MECERRDMDVYRQGKAITDQFYVDDDYNVPDAKSDVGNVIIGEGSLLVEDMKVVENYIRVSGRLAFKVLYVAEDGSKRLCALEGKIPFEEMVYMEEAHEGNLFLKSSQTDVTVTMIHSRKLNIKALCELQICSEKRETISLTTDTQADFPLYKKFCKEQVLRLNAIQKDTYRIKEEVPVGGTKESIGTLLWTEATSRRLDTRLTDGGLLLNGELLLFCFYESPDGKTDWLEQTIPYEGRMECPGAEEHMYHHIYPTLTDVGIEPRMDEDGEMRLIGVEATLEARILVCEEETVDILEDLYSLSQECTPKIQDEIVERLLMQNHSKCKVVERLSLPEIKDSILQICHSSARIQAEHTEAEEGGIRIEGVLHIYFLYVKADDEVPFGVWQGMVPFSHLLESNETGENMSYDITCGVEQLSVGLLGSDEIEVKAVLAFNSFLRNQRAVRNIEEVETAPFNMEELERRPGIVGYIVKDGDSLWRLAKNYSTTTEGIMEVNHMASEDIKPGDKILIFKENMSIL